MTHPLTIAAQVRRVRMLAYRHALAAEKLASAPVAAEFHRYTAEVLNDLALIVAQGGAA